MINKLFNLSRLNKSLLLLILDILLLPTALWSAFSLRLSEFYIPAGEQWLLFIAAPIIALPIFIRTGLYRAVLRYMGDQVLWTIVKGVSLSVTLWGLMVFISGISGIPRSIVFIYWFTSLLAVAGSRIGVRWLYSKLCVLDEDQKAVVIYGAGGGGSQLLSALRHEHDLIPIAFLDDDPTLIGREVDGIKIYKQTKLRELIDSKRVEEVLLAVPSASRASRKRIITWLEDFPIRVRVLPSVSELTSGTLSVDDLREIQIEDLLGRDPVPPDPRLLMGCIRGKSVMVTGAGGSIGSELCRQIIQISPKRIILLERSEPALYQIDKELRESVKTLPSTKTLPIELQTKKPEIISLLGSVLHRDRLEMACRAFGVQTIYHTAAYKHVPMVELNPLEAVYNNIFGTYRTAQAALSTGVETFVLISTDKAVRPTNVMGATKRFAELILQGLSAKHSDDITPIAYNKTKYKKTRFCMVRFGNVLNSSGSVVPLFQEQITRGGPITLTHEKIIRYFMTIPEAAQLVIQASAMSKGGEVFVLDMGEPIRISDLAKQMIHLAGLEVKSEESPEGDIEIKVTGLRPGEKLYEELLIGNNTSKTDHPKIMRAKEIMLPWQDVQDFINEFEKACHNIDFEQISDILREAIEEYSQQHNRNKDTVWRHSQVV